jgi:hypothetical protein
LICDGDSMISKSFLWFQFNLDLTTRCSGSIGLKSYHQQNNPAAAESQQQLFLPLSIKRVHTCQLQYTGSIKDFPVVSNSSEVRENVLSRKTFSRKRASKSFMTFLPQSQHPTSSAILTAASPAKVTTGPKGETPPITEHRT